MEEKKQEKLNELAKDLMKVATKHNFPIATMASPVHLFSLVVKYNDWVDEVKEDYNIKD